MTYEILIRPEAENDILDASNWYQKQLDGLGLDFLNVLSDTFQYLVENPTMFPVVHKDVYRVLVRRFPFAIFIVIAVYHASRNPHHWKSR